MKIYLIEHTPSNFNQAARWAADNNKDFFPDVTGVEKGFGLKVRRKIYGNYLDCLIKPEDGSVISASKALIESGIFQEFEIMKPDFSKVRSEKEYINDGILRLVETRETEPETDISLAEVVFIGGRGLRTRENYELMKSAAISRGVAYGCTRPAAASGWDTFSRVAGVSGKSLNAKLCILFGVSGSGPFISGLTNVKKIIAVNNDASALVFEYADVGIVGDAVKIIRSLGKGE